MQHSELAVVGGGPEYRKAGRTPLYPQDALDEYAALKAKTRQFAANVLPIINEVRAAGHISLNAIAGQLNARKVPTALGRPVDSRSSPADFGSRHRGHNEMSGRVASARSRGLSQPA